MSLSPNTRLGTHEIIGLLGVGGMGEVYRARDSRLNRQVAIKVLPAEYARDAERVARFEREADLLRTVRHPNVVGFAGYGTLEDGTQFLVMEHLLGESLHDRMRARRPLPPEEALPIFIGIFSLEPPN